MFVTHRQNNNIIQKIIGIIGKVIANPEKQYTKVKQHFQKQIYNASKINVQWCIGNPKLLNNRISVEEKKCIK